MLISNDSATQPFTCVSYVVFYNYAGPIPLQANAILYHFLRLFFCLIFVSIFLWFRAWTQQCLAILRPLVKLPLNLQTKQTHLL